MPLPRETSLKNRLFVWAIAIVGFFLSAVIAATLYPWMMVVISIGVGASAIAFLMNPQVQLAVEERFPLLATHPKCKGVVAGITGYCVLLFCFSVSTISTNWQVQSRNQRVATSIADAEKALSDGELDRADDLTRKLESERGTKDSSPLDRLRAQVDAARSARGVRQANDRLLQIVIAANQDLLAKQYGKVESALIEAFKMPRATEFQEAQQLANRLLLQYVNSAKDRLEANDLTTAAALARAGEQLPGVTDKAALIDLRVQIANRRVAAKVASASDHARAKRWKAAERELNDALSIEYANELVAARTLVSEVMSELGRSARLRLISVRPIESRSP